MAEVLVEDMTKLIAAGRVVMLLTAILVQPPGQNLALIATEHNTSLTLQCCSISKWRGAQEVKRVKY
jgi:hypothetical protein